MSDTVIIIINQLIGVVQRGYNHHQYMIKVKGRTNSQAEWVGNLFVNNTTPKKLT